MTTHALYRFFGDDGGLLYVGITKNPGQRWSAHGATKPWWHEVSVATIELHESRASALAAEGRAIAEELPLYNIAGRVASDRETREWIQRTLDQIPPRHGELRTIKDAADAVGLPVSEVSAAVSDGQLTTYRLPIRNDPIRVRVRDVLEFARTQYVIWGLA